MLIQVYAWDVIAGQSILIDLSWAEHGLVRNPRYKDGHYGGFFDTAIFAYNTTGDCTMLAEEFKFWAADKWQYSPARITFLAEERATPHKANELFIRRSKSQEMLDKIKAAHSSGKKKKSFSINDHMIAFIRTPELNDAIRTAISSINMDVLNSPFENDYQAAEELRLGRYTVYICNDSDCLLYSDLHTVLFMPSPVKGEAFLWNRVNALDICRKSRLLSVEAVKVADDESQETPGVEEDVVLLLHI